MSTGMPATIELPATRRPQFIARLRELFEDVAGADLGDADPNAPFVELGLDSLTLTQAALQVKKQFSVAITFRQLMESYRSFDALAGYLDATLPVDPAPAASRAVAVNVSSPSQAQAAPPGTVALPVISAMATDVSSSLVQQVIAAQMQLMAQQLVLLAGSGDGAATDAPMAPAIAAPQATAGDPASVSPARTAPASPSKPTSSNEEASATIKYDVKKDLMKELKADLSETLSLQKRTRIYVIHLDSQTKKMKGTFLFGGRKAAPWSGYAGGKGEEDEVEV